MGLDYYTARFLLQSKTAGCHFGSVLTIGRQNFVPTRPQLDDLASRFNFDAEKFLAARTPAELNYIEPFLLGPCAASAVESLDASAYEHATHIHDLNTPLPDRFAAKYDTVIECGSLEHIFNFPQAIANLMRALRVGGRLFIQTPANNYFGHGFYQFSPELYYRVLTPENGFRIARMQLLEHFYPAHFFATPLYDVTDPAQLKKRVQLINNRPTLLLIEAQKLEEKILFQKSPQQSDYVPLWQTQSSALSPQSSLPPCLAPSLKQRLYSIPLKLTATLFAQHQLNKRDTPALSNSEFFRESE